MATTKENREWRRRWVADQALKTLRRLEAAGQADRVAELVEKFRLPSEALVKSWQDSLRSFDPPHGLRGRDVAAGLQDAARTWQAR